VYTYFRSSSFSHVKRSTFIRNEETFKQLKKRERVFMTNNFFKVYKRLLRATAVPAGTAESAY